MWRVGVTTPALVTASPESRAYADPALLGRRCLALHLETVPFPANGLDESLAELAAQIAHIHIDEVGLGIEVHAPGHGQ